MERDNESVVNQLAVYIQTVGCRSNQADSSVLEAHLHPETICVVSSWEDANVVVINTCCVTVEAERDCKKFARRVLRAQPQCRVLFTGCAVSAFSSFASDFSAQVVSLGGGATSPKDIAAWLNDFAKGSVPLSFVQLPSTKSRTYAYFHGSLDESYRAVDNIHGRTRGLLKIQNGCTHNCSYCIVPKARGPEQSMSVDEVLKNVAQRKRDGHAELVLTGVQIGAWGKDIIGSISLSELLDRIAILFSPGRVRLGSIEPWSVDGELIDVVASHRNICNHLHIPLQSGDDGVLTDMKRGYTALQWLNTVQLAKTKIGEVAIGTDVICGFPTETEQAFNNSLTILAQAQVAYVHGFSYSRRPGTLAAKLYGENRTVAKERVRRVRAQAETWRSAYVESQVGRECEVLIEESFRGLTDTFLQVSTDFGKRGQLVSCVLQRCGDVVDSLCAKKM